MFRERSAPIWNAAAAAAAARVAKETQKAPSRDVFVGTGRRRIDTAARQPAERYETAARAVDT